MKNYSKKILLCIVIAFSLTSASMTFSAEVAFNDKFNFKNLKELDLKTINSKNFIDKLLPLAQKQKEVNFYNFAAGSFPNLFKGLLPDFEKKYGIKVNLFNVQNSIALQQLIATKKANKDSPTDLFMIPSIDILPLKRNDLLGNINLYKLLPNTQSDIVASNEELGIKHFGSYVHFHASQVALGYNSSKISEKEVPTTYAELLSYSKKHPKAIALTSPLKGGSGIGFLVGVAHSKLKTKACIDKWNGAFQDEGTITKWVKESGCFTDTWKYFRELYNNIEFTNGNADTLNLLSNGVVEIGTVWEDMVYDEINAGTANPAIRMSLVKDGMPGTFNGMVVLSTGQHIAGALILLNYFLSDEVQIKKLKFMASRSPKSAFNMNIIPKDKRELLIPLEQYNNYHIEWASPILETVLSNNFIAEVIEKIKK